MSLTIAPAAAPGPAPAAAAAGTPSSDGGAEFASVLAGSTDAPAADATTPVAMPRGDSGRDGSKDEGAATHAGPGSSRHPAVADEAAAGQQPVSLQAALAQTAAAQATVAVLPASQPAPAPAQAASVPAATVAPATATAAPQPPSSAFVATAAAAAQVAGRPRVADPRPVQAATAAAASTDTAATDAPKGIVSVTDPAPVAPAPVALPAGFTPVQSSGTAPQQVTPAVSQPVSAPETPVTAALTQLVAATANAAPQLRPVATSAPVPTTSPSKPASTVGTVGTVGMVGTVGTVASAPRQPAADAATAVLTSRDRPALREPAGRERTVAKADDAPRTFAATLTGEVAHAASDAAQPTQQPAPAAIQPTAAVHPTTAATPAAAFVPASAQPLPVQLAAPLLTLRAGGDGSHSMIIALHPAELGPVDVHVRITGDAMTIQLAGGIDAHDALREALPQLRQELQAAGLSSVGLSLNAAGADAGSADQYSPNADTGGRQGREQAAPAARYPEPASARVSRPQTSTGLDRWL